ncbi:hypothetical protein ACFFV7_45420 [Nonomuraea spiralis]|uniref:PLL-like beta propeller domain-containing protein n=1 Tax=Nonomuraea spiralis TaxID=46182 RepID=A0ABV5IV96_9ACTN|nr:hypothetical protein [Nonomuraea spiralis]GGS82925.1 hypothetical protein GCM10010176_028030 [Nonomuraea spiralis]
MTVAQNADGRLEVFARGNDDALIHTYQTRPNNDWSFWSSLGGGLAGQPAVARNADGRLEAFSITEDGALWHMWQIAPNSGWSDWQTLGGRLSSSPVLAMNPDGRLEVFAVGADGDLVHLWQVAPSNGWSSWESLGGRLRHPIPGRRAASLDVIANHDGRLEVFAVGSDNDLLHIWQPAPWSGWSEWASLGGRLLTAPAAQRNLDGRLEVFALGADRAMWHIWQGAPGRAWSSWNPLGEERGFIDPPSAARNADGRLEVFVRGGDAALWHIWQTEPGNGWSRWESLGGQLESDRQVWLGCAPTVGANADARLEVFVRRDDTAVTHIWQRVPDGGWSEWDRLGGWQASALGQGWREP